MPAAVRLRGALDVSALAAALTEIVRRHEVLRTSFASVDGRPVQRIAPPAAVPLARTDLANLPDPAAEARRLTAAEAGAPFDLARGPVVRFQLLRLGVDEHVLLVNLHHIAADGWSAGVLVRELTALYGAFAAGRPSPLPPLPGQYADFAAWQRSWLEADAERQLAFWRQRLAGAPAALELPADRPRPAVSDPRGGRYAFALPAGLSRDLQALARREGATLFMTLLAAFTALLSRLGGQDDVVVGTAVANRDRVEIEPLIGFFVNSLPLRVPLGGSPGLRELLGRTRETTLAAYAHQDLPFERLVEDLQPGRDLALPPLFQAMLVLQNAPLPALELPGLSIETLEADSGMVKLPLSLSMMERDGALAGSLGYQSALFDPATARRIAGQLGVLLEAAVGAPDEPYKDLPLMPAPERHQVLVEWSAVPALPGIEQTIHGLIAAQAARTPEATAVACEGERLTYGELDRESNRLARRLRAWGVAPDDRVGLYMERSAATITAILAVLKAGGAYVPLDPSFPQERLEWMLEAADARVLLTHEALAGRPLATSARTLPVDERSLWADLSGAPLEGGAGPENLVYVMFTSGSTGRPKGVALEHRALVSYTGAVLERLRLPAGSSFATVSTLAADLGNTAVFPALTTGGCLHVVAGHRVADPLALAEYFGDTPVDCLKIVPSHLAALLSAPDPRRVLPRRVLVLGGEAAGRDLLERVRELAPECRIVNHYGPTEAAVGVLAGLVEELPDGGRPAPLGRPLGGVRIHLVDRCLQPVPRGVAGELVIGGASLARGYFGRPDLTAERFLPSPWGEAGARIYRTGDLARHLPDGRAELLGRIDGQVKIRGYRVEPGEVEAALLAHPAVRAAAVEARSIAGELRLVAYVVAEDQGARELAGFLRGRLPEAMVPAAFVPLAALPLTPNGKLDRRALPAPSEEAADGEVTTGAPRTPVEELLAGIWAGLLGRQRIGVEEDFFAAGGHSLLATRLASRVHQVFGVELPLRAIFEAPTLAAMAGRIGQAGRRAAAPPLEPARDSGESPLSFSQERLWFLEQLEPGTALYNLPYHARLEGTLDAGALASALSEIARRHAVLRTSFPAVAGRPVQRVAPPSAIDLPIEDLSALPEPERGEQGLRLAREEARRPFDLERGPLMRARLVRLAADEHLLLLSLHHAVSDAWSRGILVAELATLYGAFAAGRPSPLAEPALQYADFARWQRQWLQGEALEEQLDYWRRHLADQPGSLELPTDRPRPARRSRRGARRPVELPVDLTDLGRRQGSTLYMTVLAAFAALLHRYTGQNAIAVGSPVAGRNRAETEGLIGFFVNTLVLATDLGGDPAFGELLGRVREVALEAWARQDLPFEKLVSELRPDRDLGQTPFFQVTFVLQNAPQPPLALPGLSLTPLESDTGAAKFDLTLALAEDGRGGLSGLIEYDAELFDPATIARLEGHLGGLLAAAAADPGKRLWDLPMLGAAERHQLLLGANDTERPFPTAFVHELFADQARRTPSAVAVAAEDGTLTYAELDRRANGLAHRLARLGVGPDVRVGLCLERSLEMVVGLLGLLKAGGAYVPLDPEYPRERLDFMLEDSRAGVLLTQERFRERLAGAAETVLCLDGEPVAGGDPGPLAVRLAPENLAYLIYTSGSTGRPKGAMIPHGSLANHMLWMQERYPLAGDDSVLQKTPFSFDASVWEIWAPLLAGARLVMARPGGHRDAEYLAEALAEGGITTLQLVPAQLSILLREPGFAACRSLRRVYCGGEALPAALAAELRELLGVDAVNLYGPAETCIQVLSWTAERTSSGPTVPIGRPIDNARVHLLDRNLEPAPLGVPAELYVGGAALGRGYWQRPDLTAARFLPDPIGGEPGGRLYRTGDLARRRSDGALEFLDRVDQQVKVRGFRIELGEIEALLARHPAVREAAAGVHRGSHGDILAAWAVLRPGAAADAGELRAWLAAELPEFMVPAAFVFLPALPLSPSGKLDRRALPAPDGSAFGSGAGAAAPRTPVEELLAGLWSELLEVERVGIHDNFFQLGGHSLLAARLAARLRQSLRVDLPLRALFEAPTVAGLAALVESAQRVEALPPLAAVSREEALPLSPGQERLWFLQRLDPASAAYNLTSSFRLAGRLDVAALERCLAELTRRHEPLRTSFPERGGQPSQVIAPASSSEGLALVDLGGLPAAERTAEARRLTREAARRPFDLSRAPLLRTLLLRLAPEEHALLAVMHHIVGDGWSMGVLAREVGILYTAFAAGSPSPLAEPAVQYADFAAWQRRWLEDEAGAVDGQLAYWRRQLAGAPEPPVLPAARPRLILAGTPGTPGTAGEVLPFAIDPETSAELLRLSRREDATLFMTLLAAFDVLLYGLTGQTDLAVGTPVAGRRRVETEGLIGFFLNTLVLRGDLGGDPTFRELLARVRDVALDAYAHQDLPYERLVADLRGRDRSPLFRIWFVLQNTPAAALELPRLTLTSEEIGAGEVRHDLKLDLTETPQGLAGFFQYRRELFARGEVSHMAESFAALLRRVVGEPDLRLSDLAETVEEAGKTRMVRVEGDFQRSRQQELQSLTRSARRRSTAKDV
ncbi:MAG TPA: amino acid adenylation domain-containing protein [Thermoanaerobaculia bacterium]|nr:amino acid adenylation domain-containing protein [Thermoanaerobaculia bacterium]